MPKRWIRWESHGAGLNISNLEFDNALRKAVGTRSRLGMLQKRAGWEQFGDKPTTDAVTSLIKAGYSSGTDILRCEPDDVRVYDGGTDTWSDILPAGYVWTTDEQYVWRGAMIFDTLYLSNGLRFSTTGPVLTNDGVLSKATPGTGTASAVTDSPGVKDLVAFGSRLVGINPHYSDGSFYPYRLVATDVGVPTDWYTNGIAIDLPDDGYTLQRLIVVGGRMFVLAGGVDGGTIRVGHLTPSATQPFAFELLRGVGILGPNTLVRVSTGLAYFLGHDNFYQITPAGIEGVARDNGIADRILETFDTDEIDKAFCYYRPQTNDIHVSVPTSANSREEFVLNLRTQQWTGPDDSSNSRAGVFTQITVQDTWQNTPLTDLWVGGDDSTWAQSSSTLGRPVTLVARDDGIVAKVGEVFDDNGDDIPLVIETHPIVPDREPYIKHPRQRFPVFASVGDEICYDGIIVRYCDKGTVAVTIRVSKDGGALWTEIYSGNIGSTPDDGIREFVHSFAPIISANGLVVNIENEDTNKLALVGMALRTQHVTHHRS